MKKNTSWKFTDELSVTFQSSISGPGEFGLKFKQLFTSIDFIIYIHTIGNSELALHSR